MHALTRAAASAAALGLLMAARTYAQTRPASVPATDTAPASAAATLQAAPLSLDPNATQPATSEPTALQKVTVTGEDLDQTRDQIAPSLGAVSYTVGPAQIQNIAGGENASFQQVLLHAPGVVPDSFGGEHVRGEHANLTYRINGVLLPQPLESFAQELDTRIVQSVTLIDGSLPAQFGFHTAGIVDVTTKSGASLNHNELSLYGGSYDTVRPSFQFGGTAGRLDYFITGTFNHTGLGLENPTGTHDPLHDYSNQQRLFGYFSYVIDDSSRLSLILNAADSDYQIPDSADQSPQFRYTGHSNTNSTLVNENQNQQEYYSVLAYQKNFERLALQLSVFSRYASVNFHPDVANDLIFLGSAGQVYNGFTTNGVQFDASYLLTDSHTLRGGFIADYTCEKLDANTEVFQTDPSTGNQSTFTPTDIVSHSGNNALEAGLYLQDEWKVTDKLTLNYGLRADRFDANFDHEGQISPRVNLVYKADDATTLHLGYARYFVPPPVQDVRLVTLNAFQNTTNAPENFQDDPPKVERSNYFDGGISHQFSKEWQVTLDGFYKKAHNLIDLGQFGAPVILAPYNYRKGFVYGAELSTTYTSGGLSLFGNFSWVRAYGSQPDSQQFLWANDELAFARTHNVALDHAGEYTISSGASYAWKDDRVYIDFLMESGLRQGFDNTQKTQVYYPVNVGWEHTFHFAGASAGRDAVKFRIDVVNLFDEKYVIRSGSGIGVGAPQFGERLGFFAGVTYEF